MFETIEPFRGEVLPQIFNGLVIYWRSAQEFRPCLHMRWSVSGLRVCEVPEAALPQHVRELVREHLPPAGFFSPEDGTRLTDTMLTAWQDVTAQEVLPDCWEGPFVRPAMLGFRGLPDLPFCCGPDPADLTGKSIPFLLTGLSFMPQHAQDTTTALMAPARLLPLFDFQNTYDPRAILLRTETPPMLLGYVPRWLATGIHHQWRAAEGSLDSVPLQFELQRVQLRAPVSSRLICRLVHEDATDALLASLWPSGSSARDNG